MTKVTSVTKTLNFFLALVLFTAVLGFLSFANIYGIFLATITAVIGVGVLKHNRWAYFASAAWALACYQLAKQGYEFEIIKRWVMISGFLIISLSIYLHEKLGKKSTQVTKSPSDKG